MTVIETPSSFVGDEPAMRKRIASRGGSPYDTNVLSAGLGPLAVRADAGLTHLATARARPEWVAEPAARVPGWRTCKDRAMNVEAIVARIWPGEPAHVEVLGGGITNHNFKIVLRDGSYVLRVAGSDTALLGIDRAVEHEASLAAAAVGVGPDVVAFVEPEGYLVTRFIEGSIVPVESMRAAENIGRVAQALRAIHRGPTLPARFISFRVVEDYRTIAFSHGAEVPPSYAWARQIARKVERARGSFAERPCHNDLLNANFIDDGRRIRIVDWEYAAMGDVFFDLANFSVNHGLDRDARRDLLAAYAGSVRPEDERALELMQFMSDFREAMWAVVQSAASELEFDFAAYATEHFERMEATVAAPAFVSALGDTS